MLGQSVGGFLLFCCLGEYELQVGERGECFFAEVEVQFFLEDCGHVLRRGKDGVGGGDGGVQKIFVFEKHHA